MTEQWVWVIAACCASFLLGWVGGASRRRGGGYGPDPPRDPLSPFISRHTSGSPGRGSTGFKPVPLVRWGPGGDFVRDWPADVDAGPPAGEAGRDGGNPR